MDCVLRYVHDHCWDSCPQCCGYRVIVTGSRSWDDRGQVFGVLTQLAQELHDCGIRRLVIVHGKCRQGADRHAAAWTHSRLYPLDMTVVEEPHPAKWIVNGKRCPYAGFERNEKMAGLGANWCIAFVKPCAKKTCPKTRGPSIPPHYSHGTSQMIRSAKYYDIPVTEYKDGFG
jgi:YspA, cpYpsA-related SLOG family